jgi:hypothetical protein
MNTNIIKAAAVIAAVASLTACGEKFTAKQYGECAGATAAVVTYNKSVGPAVNEFFFKNPNGQARFSAIHNQLVGVLGPNYTPSEVQQYFARGGGTAEQEDYLEAFFRVYRRGGSTNSIDREGAVLAYCEGIIK